MKENLMTPQPDLSPDPRGGGVASGSGTEDKFGPDTPRGYQASVLSDQQAKEAAEFLEKQDAAHERFVEGKTGK